MENVLHDCASYAKHPIWKVDGWQCSKLIDWLPDRLIDRMVNCYTAHLHSKAISANQRFYITFLGFILASCDRQAHRYEVKWWLKRNLRLIPCTRDKGNSVEYDGCTIAVPVDYFKGRSFVDYFGQLKPTTSPFYSYLKHGLLKTKLTSCIIRYACQSSCAKCLWFPWGHGLGTGEIKRVYS
jgi:hypothetical protein